MAAATGLLIDVLARGVAIGALAALAAGLWGAGRGSPVRVAGVLFCASVIAYAINASPPLHQAFGWAGNLTHFLSLGGGGLFWLFILALFEDRPVRPATLAPWAGLTGIGLLAIASPAPLEQGLWVAHNFAEAALAAHALYVIVRSWRGDLVEARRRLRGPFLAAVTFYVLTLSGVEIAESLGMEATPQLRLAGGLSLALYCALGAMVFLRARTDLFGAATPPAPPAGADLADRHLLARLEQRMGPGEAWRREGLTIGALAEEVGAPEHRLRRLINDQLGFRNFAAFVNARRIAAAKTMLTAPELARKPVSAIAFELGFGSLGPFNRAFKEATGLTPTQWRRQAANAASPNSENAG